MENFFYKIYCKPVASLGFIAVVIFISLLIIYHYYRRLKLKKLPPKFFYSLLCLRTLALLLILLALLNPVAPDISKNSEAGKIIFLVDSSSSMEVKDKNKVSRFIRALNIANFISERLTGTRLIKDKKNLSINTKDHLYAPTHKYENNVHTDLLFFDNKLHKPDYRFVRAKTSGILQTDIVGAITSLNRKYNLSSCKAIVMITDGGDDTETRLKMRDIPIFSIGIGTNPLHWNNIGIKNLTYPSNPEENLPFTIHVDISVTRTNGKDKKIFNSELTNVNIYLEEKINVNKNSEQWKVLDHRDKNLSDKNLITEIFEIKPLGRKTQSHIISNHNYPPHNLPKSQILKKINNSVHKIPSFANINSANPAYHVYRIRIEKKKHELYCLDNARKFDIEVKKKTIHILYITDSITMNYKVLRRELAGDKTIAFTALYPTLFNKINLQTEDNNITEKQKKNLTLFFSRDEKKEATLSSDGSKAQTAVAEHMLRTLKYFDIIIFGTIKNLSPNSNKTQLFERYVSDGGVIVFSEPIENIKEKIFLRLLKKLLPWQIYTPYTLKTGRFIVNLDKRGLISPLMANTPLETLMTNTAENYVESLVIHGKLKKGATSVFNTKIGNTFISLMAYQIYGEGKILAFSTNTLWKWALQGGNQKKLFSLLWAQTIRFLANSNDNTPFLEIIWDKNDYQLDEKAKIRIKIKKDYSPGISLKGEVYYLTPSSRQNRKFFLTLHKEKATFENPIYTTSFKFEKRGIYKFFITLFENNMQIDKYIRTLKVSPLPQEGITPEVKKKFLSYISSTTQAKFFMESEHEKVIPELINLLKSKRTPEITSLIYSYPWFLLFLIFVLTTEWALLYYYRNHHEIFLSQEKGEK